MQAEVSTAMQEMPTYRQLYHDGARYLSRMKEAKEDEDQEESKREQEEEMIMVILLVDNQEQPLQSFDQLS